MITSLAVDRKFAYLLDDNVITRVQLNAQGNIDILAGPDVGSISQIMTTNESIFVLTDQGVFSRDNDGATWDEVTVPEGVTYLSSSDHFLYALIDGDLYQQDKETGPFLRVYGTLAVTRIAQVDHDEQFGYALLESGKVWMRKIPDGNWFAFPELSGVVQVVAGFEFIYARTVDGNVYRSKVFGESKWEALQVDDVALLAIASDHSDRLWMIKRETLESVGVLDFVSIFEFGEPIDTAWIDADWIDGDWIEVA